MTDLSSKVAQVTVLVGAADPGKRKVVFGVFQENGKPIFDRTVPQSDRELTRFIS